MTKFLEKIRYSSPRNRSIPPILKGLEALSPGLRGTGYPGLGSFGHQLCKRALQKSLIRASSIPKECNNLSRWLSRPAIPPDPNLLLNLPRKGSTESDTLPGYVFTTPVPVVFARSGLDHQLGLSQASGLHKQSRSTFAEVSVRVESPQPQNISFAPAATPSGLGGGKPTQGRRCCANPGLSDHNPVRVVKGSTLFSCFVVPAPRGMESTLDNPAIP
jgi:hypothetical protein